MITSLALVACIQAVSLVPISWDDSEAKAKTANNSNQATAYGNEAEHLQAKAHKTVAATFSLSEHCNIYIERKKNPVKKKQNNPVPEQPLTCYTHLAKAIVEWVVSCVSVKINRMDRKVLNAYN